MADSLRTNGYYQGLEAKHRDWLSTFDRQYLRNWEKLLKDNEEAALAESGIRRLLRSIGASVEPNEDLSGKEQRADFHCKSNGSCFEVEVTHISIKKATEVTGLVKDPFTNLAEGPPDFTYIRPLNSAVFWACVNKAKQCADTRHPTILAVATFHYGAAVSCFDDKFEVGQLLTGSTSMRLSLDKQFDQRDCETYYVTDLHSALFLRPDSSESVGFARRSVSALLLCGLCALLQDSHGVWRPQVIGLLHPNPARPFNAATLLQVEFGQVVVDQESGKFRVDWPKNDNEHSA